MPFFSVIVPGFDNRKFLEACLGSIRESSFQDFELLVADDGPAGGASIGRVAESHGARVTRTETNHGPAAALRIDLRRRLGRVLQEQ